MRPLRLLASGMVAAGVAALLLPSGRRPGAAPTVAGSAGAPLVVVSLPGGAPEGEPGRLPAGGRLLLVPRDGGGVPRDLAPGFDAAGAPRVSFDGTRVLFAGRRSPADPDGIWTVAPGSPPRPVIVREGGCGDPEWLPGGRVLFTAPAPGFAGEGGARGRSLFSSGEDGRGAVRLTYRPGGIDREPAVLADGRILFVASAEPREGTVLLAVHNDGTGVHAFHGPLAGEGERRRPRETGDRGVVFTEGRGNPVRVDARRPAREAFPLLPGLEGLLGAPEPIPGGGFLAPWRPEAGRPTWGIRRLLPGRPPATVLDDPDRDEVEAVPFSPRLPPRGHLSLVDPAKSTGRLLLLDGRRGPGIPPSGPRPEALRIRVSLPPGDPAGWDGRPEALLGTVPLAADGSLYAEVPADRPLTVDLLAADGTVIGSSGPRFWVRPGETRACIGCHEDPAVAPPNAFPEAAGGEPVDLSRPAREGSSR